MTKSERGNGAEDRSPIVCSSFEPRHSFVIRHLSFVISRRFEKQAFESSRRSSPGNKLRARVCGERFNLIDEFVGSIFENEFGLIFDSEEFFESSLTHEHAIGEDADPIANFLDLRKQVR